MTDITLYRRFQGVLRCVERKTASVSDSEYMEGLRWACHILSTRLSTQVP
jgi:hypothetical protein